MALAIRDDLMPEALRRQARPTPNRQAALRMLAIVGVLDGLSRTEGAERRSHWLAGLERQAFCLIPMSTSEPDFIGDPRND